MTDLDLIEFAKAQAASAQNESLAWAKLVSTLQGEQVQVQPPTGFKGRSVVDPAQWKTTMEDDFQTLCAEGGFLTTYGNLWGAYPNSYLTTSKKGYYEPGHISVIDTPSGDRVMQCRLVPGFKNANGRPSGTAAQPKIRGSASNGTKGEKLEIRVKIDAAGDHWHAANLGWVLHDSDWPKLGEDDFWEQGLTGTVAANLHVQNGGTHGEGQVQIKTNTDAKADFVVIGRERVPGVSYKYFINGALVKTVLDADLKSSSGNLYGVPNDFFRWVLQLEDDGTLPLQEGRVWYDWITIWEPAA